MATKKELAYSAGYVAAGEGKPKVPAMCETFIECVEGMDVFVQREGIAESWLHGYEDAKINDARMKTVMNTERMMKESGAESESIIKRLIEKFK